MGEAGVVGGGALLRGAHRIAVVFDHVNDRNPEQGRDVEGLVKSALVDRAVTEVAEAATLATEVFQAIGKPETERRLAGDDAVATPEILVGCEEMHGAALAFGATGLLAEHFSHALIHAHADSECVAVVTVSGDEMVVCATEGNGPYGDSFLADVEVEEAGHFAAVVVFQRCLFESPDANHLGVELDLTLGCERLVDRRTGEIKLAVSGAGHDGDEKWERRLLGENRSGNRNLGLRQAELGEGEDSSEKDVGRSEVAEEDPRWECRMGGSGPDGLPEAGEGFLIHRITEPGRGVGDEVEKDRRYHRTDEQGGDAIFCKAFAQEKCRSECDQGGDENLEVEMLSHAERIGDYPNP